jgi:hypothetical protein
MELAVVLEEWLRRIPEFEVDDERTPNERGGQLMLRRVDLRWPVNGCDG